MNKQFGKDFLHCLETASPEQLREAAERAARQLETVIDGEVRSDLRRMIRLIEEETTLRWMPRGARRRSIAVTRSSAASSPRQIPRKRQSSASA